MARKRFVRETDLPSSGGSESGGSGNIQCSQQPFLDYDSCEFHSDYEFVEEDDSSSENSSFDQHLYEKCLKDLEKMKNMKRKLEMAMKHKSKKKRIEKNSKDGFTRFSVTAFMNVISALTPEKKAIIESYGFGSLLLFNKCIVPNKFATWVSRLVDSKSGDIIRDGKVISLTTELVHLVLGLPLGSKPFPSDPSVGKAIVLSKFGKDRIPPVSFFAEKLINKAHLSDEDMFICFMVVSLSCFLCPNTNTVPSPKYFGIFEDIENMKDFNWCGFVLDWLLEHIKAFNRGKSDKLKRCQGLGGCLYYLAVVYLDHIDFGQRNVPDLIPRISVWKEDMVQFYSGLDLRSHGIYGYRPILDFEKTCYFKAACMKDVSKDDLDAEFCQKMEMVSGCKLHLSLKLRISKLIDQHSFNSGLAFNMDLGSLRTVSREFQDMFAKMLRHVCKIDVSTKDLVLDIMEAIAQTDPVIDDAANSEGIVAPPNIDLDLSASIPRGSVVPKVSEKGSIASTSKSARKHVAFRSYNNVIDVDLEDAKGNMKKSSPALLSQRLERMSGGVNATVQNPLCDITNVGSTSSSRSKRSDFDRDVIEIDKENIIVPDSVSPSPFRHRSRLIASKVSQDVENGSLNSRDEDGLFMETIPFTVDPSHITPNLPKSPAVFILGNHSARRLHSSAVKDKDTSPVVCTGSRSFSQSVKVQTKKADAMYNYSQSGKSRKASETPVISLRKTHGFPADSSIDPESFANRSDFKIRDSTTGGKLPIHGPRRMVYPSRVLNDDFIVTENKFKVSTSEIANYKAICALANSRSSNVDALYFGGVHCTYWSLGESMKPGGKVMSYVVAAFCYHLFCRPDGHPDISKRHYFFSNISDCLLKDHDEVSGDVMMRAFERSSKARPLFKSDMLYFPTFYEDHWFVFVVDIKDMNFVFLDSFYSEGHAYQQYVREIMIPQFQYWWDKFVKKDVKFNEFGVIYPSVPKQPPENNVDSGIYTMMFLEHWCSPRSRLFSLFCQDDIPNIRIKLSNDMLFNPRNTGNKNLVISYDMSEGGGSE